MKEDQEVFIGQLGQRKLLGYLLVSALSFLFLVLVDYVGIGMPVFAALQAACLWFVLPERRRLWWMLPVFLLALNAFLSANQMWWPINVMVCTALYCVMLIDFDLCDTSLRFVGRLIGRLFAPLGQMHLPVAWLVKANKRKAALIKRVLIALCITLPAVFILTALLSGADMVFSRGVEAFWQAVFQAINLDTLFRVLFSLLVGFYLFGLLYSAYLPKKEPVAAGNAAKGDLLIFHVLLVSMLILYTIFIAVQFRYLFAGAALPYGLTYTEYARKGFFEQFALTGVNIAVIWITVHYTKAVQSRWTKATKGLCCYLCAVTVLLLVSSFYRMHLYYVDDGLTRLRFLVFGFLLFELLGLITTFFYIARPGFNIVVVYLGLGLCYYLLLNLVPMDYFVAQSQINRYFAGDPGGIAYTMTLSADAAPQIERLLDEQTVDATTRNQAVQYLQEKKAYYTQTRTDWRQWNLAAERLP